MPDLVGGGSGAFPIPDGRHGRGTARRLLFCKGVNEDRAPFTLYTVERSRGFREALVFVVGERLVAIKMPQIGVNFETDLVIENSKW